MNGDGPNQDAMRRRRVAGTERLISTLLRGGVVSSLTVIVLGTLISFIHHPDYLCSAPALQRLIDPAASFPHTLGAVLRGALAGRGESIVLIGLLLLILTPILRVALSALIFLHAGDRKFTAITLVVLTLLITSFLLGKVGG